MSEATVGYLMQRIEDSTTDSQAAHYIAKFRAMETHFFKYIHPQVDTSLALSSVNSKTSDIMTIHGCRHVVDLIDSLDKLGSSIEDKRMESALNPREAYVLLCAAHLHDAGNIGGRKNHPERSGQLIKKHRSLFHDTETCHNIYDVARVHGGESPKYGRDTFNELQGDNFASPRLRLLAAMLRLGDELSENPERVPEAVREWFQASPHSNLAFRYAQAFSGFRLQNDTLDIRFRLYPEQYLYTTKTCGHVATFFEHLERKIDVIEKEARYCSQYGRPDLDVRRIRITLEYFSKDFPSECTKRSKLTLELERGYPGKLAPLMERCSEELSESTFEALCGGG